MAKVRGLTIDVGANVTEFNKGMRGMKREIRETSRDVGALSKSLELDFDASTFEQAQQKAQEAIEQTDQKAETLRERLEHLEDTGKVDTKHYREVQSELIRTETQSRALAAKLQEIKDMRIDELAKRFENLGDGITKAGNAMKPLSTIAAGLLGTFSAIGMSTVNLGNQLGITATQFNINAEALQRWQYIAGQTGVENAQLENSFRRIQQGLGQLATGETNGMAQALQELGLTAEQAMQGMDQNLDQIIYSLANMEDEVMQAHYANEIFGSRMGAQMIPLLKAGGDAIDELTAEFESMGYLTNEQVAQMDVFEDTIGRLTHAFKAIKNEIGLAMVPVLESLANVFEHRILPAFQRLADWFGSLSNAQKNMIAITLSLVAAAAPLLLIVGKLTSGIGSAIRSVAGLNKALMTLMANPIVAIIAGIIAIMAILYARNEDFRESIQELGRTIMSALQPILDVIISTFRVLLSAIIPIIDVIAAILTPAIQALALGFQLVATILEPLLNLLSVILVPILDLIGSRIEWLANLIMKVLNPAFEKIMNVVRHVFEFIANVIDSTISFIENQINSLIDMINNVIRQFNRLAGIFGKEVSEMEHVTLRSERRLEQDLKVSDDREDQTRPETAIGQTAPDQVPQSVVNNDYSERDITIQVTVENYAERVDVDDMIRQINIKLAEAM